MLCVTGCEALYADMGHFGARAIRISWYFVALPALVLNYFGQGAVILQDPANAGESFFSLSSTLSALPDGPALHDRHDHSLAGHNLRGLLTDPAGHSTGLPAAHEGRAHIGNGRRAGLSPRCKCSHDGGGHRDSALLQGVRQPCRRLRHSGHRDHAHHFGGILLHLQVDLGMERHQGPAALFAFLRQWTSPTSVHACRNSPPAAGCPFPALCWSWLSWSPGGTAGRGWR